jgi:hypothetical protein
LSTGSTSIFGWKIEESPTELVRLKRIASFTGQPIVISYVGAVIYLRISMKEGRQEVRHKCEQLLFRKSADEETIWNTGM